MKNVLLQAHTKGENDWLFDLRQAYKTQDTSPPPLPSLINYFFDKILNIEPFIFGGDYVDGRKKLVAEYSNTFKHILFSPLAKRGQTNR